MRIDAILHGNEPSVNSFCEIDKQKKQFDRKKYLPPKCLLLLFGFTVNTQLFEMCAGFVQLGAPLHVSHSSRLPC